MERVWEDPAWIRELAGQIAALGGHASADAAGPAAAQVLALRMWGLYLLNKLRDSPGQVIELGVPLAADCQRVLGADHPDTLASRNNLAHAYQAAGRLGEAVPLYEQTLADTERVLGHDHSLTRTVRKNAEAAAGRHSSD